tara:strand:- start:13082 stop:13768 length:687 start_codon:yes stop_codon:yes gene_type:complete
MIVCIIPARGGSEGIPKKNLLPLCGQPLIGWTIDSALEAQEIDEIFVSTDDDEIANFAKNKGVKVIKRPVDISGGDASSESAIIHALNVIEESVDCKITLTVFLQATSPLRVRGDIAKAILLFRDSNADSLFSSSVAADLTLWNNGPHGLESVNFDYKKRLTRQVAPIQYVENGSIYIFRPELLLETGNRLGGRIETYIMQPWQIHEIDVQEDAELVEYYMERYLIGK